MRLPASILDRMGGGDPFLDPARYKDAVARDLETLLNTRCQRKGPFPGTLLGFGIPDLSSLSLLDPEDRLRLQDRIRRAIASFEPRLGEVEVTLAPEPDLPRSLRFRVDALLRVHPGQPPVVFDAQVQLATGACRVGRGA